MGSGPYGNEDAAVAPIALSRDDPRIDPRALVGFVDDAFSNGLASLLPVEIGISTLDLRIGFARNAPPEGAVVAETRATMLDGYCASADVLMRDATGGIVATGTAMFTLGGYPGGALPEFARIGNYDRTTAPATFAALIGLTAPAGPPMLAGDNPHVVGWETGQVLHGGVVAALLMEACLRGGTTAAPDQRLASLYIRYLRPGSAIQPLVSRSSVERTGRAASHIAAHCFHVEGRTVATAHATFVAARDVIQSVVP